VSWWQSVLSVLLVLLLSLSSPYCGSHWCFGARVRAREVIPSPVGGLGWGDPPDGGGGGGRSREYAVFGVAGVDGRKRVVQFAAPTAC
jgi:hypothetical protein